MKMSMFAPKSRIWLSSLYKCVLVYAPLRENDEFEVLKDICIFYLLSEMKINFYFIYLCLFLSYII